MDLNTLESSELQQQIKQFIIQQIVRPDEDLVQLLAEKIYAGKLSSENWEWFTHVTQQAIQEVFVKKQIAAPPSNSNYRHLLIIEDDHGKRELGLVNPIYSIGRDTGCDICIASPFISFHHATLVKLPREQGDYFYRIVDGDLKGTPSANGFIVNGKKVQAANLRNGDKILLGPQIHGTYYGRKKDSRQTTSVDSARSNGNGHRGMMKNLSKNLVTAFSGRQG